MIFKSYLLEQKSDPFYKYKIFLIYGENQGLKKEFKEIIKRKNEGNEKLNFLQDEILLNKNILFNEISNKSLFNEKKIILIDQVGEKIFKIVEDLLEDVTDEKIYLFCDNLDKKSKLRATLEKSKECGVVACYPDNEVTIKRIIINKLKEFKGLTPEIVNLIAHNTNLDRAKINNEIDKIKSCFLDKIIDPQKINTLLNIRTNDDFNILRDEAINGNRINTNKLLGDTIFNTENSVFYLNLINQRMSKLSEISNLKEINKNNIENLISSLKPPVFWKDKPILIQQLKKWNKIKITKMLKKTYEIETKIKSNSSVNKNLLIKKLIIDLCVSANSA